MRRDRLSDQMTDDLAAAIVGLRWEPGASLPPEPELVERFGVSRTVVREAMLRLARIGLIRVRQGAGTIVLDRAHWHDFDPELLRVRAETGLIDDLVPDLLEIRRLVEVAVAGIAAERRGEEDVARLSRLVERMTAAAAVADAGAYNDADIAFHDALTAAAGNALLRQVLRPVNEVRRVGSVISAARGPETVAASLAGHRDILAAVVAGDVAAARAAMARHITQFERDLLAMVAARTPPLGDRAGAAS